MALRTMPSRLRALPSRVSNQTDVHGHDRDREPWRGWFKTARWEALRQRVFKRDRYTCQCGCKTLIGNPRERIGDHRIPHKGDPALFWDEYNVQTLWKPHHDGWKQRLERMAER